MQVDLSPSLYYIDGVNGDNEDAQLLPGVEANQGG